VTIDIHGHITSPELLARFPMPPSLGDVDGMIEQKAALGITTTIVGSPVGAGTMVPIPGRDNYDQPVDQLTAFHDWVAEAVRDHPGRLLAYAYTNPFGGDDELELAAARLRQDEFVGLIANTSVRGEYLGTDRADSFFAMAAQHHAPILLHPPAEPVGSKSLANVGLIEHVARPCDVTTGIAAIVFAGWLDKYPDLQLIAATAGGALALLAEKLDLAHARAPVDNGGGPPSATLRRVYVDTATPSEPALLAALQTFGADRLLFGTDAPPLTSPLAAALGAVARLPVTARDKDRILGGNACRVFGLELPGSDDTREA
jgi:predicted TIM-barrel fold metal-dependent hydrolase